MNSDGHGTHVAGTALGQSESDGSLYETYEGMAPQAKVAFFDIGLPSGDLTVPDDLTS